jgi:hypothetical protein
VLPLPGIAVGAGLVAAISGMDEVGKRMVKGFSL